MYAIYSKQREGTRTNYSFHKPVNLFGCRVGLIPRLVRRSIPPNQGEPYLWHLPLESALAESGSPNKTVVIDLKPKEKEDNLSLYELIDVWGYSKDGWTPILLHLNGLFVDVDPKKDPKRYNRDNFWIEEDEREGPIYEILYVNGSVSNGDLVEKWTSPPASPTNGALLWPDRLKYFVDCIRERTPNVLK